SSDWPTWVTTGALMKPCARPTIVAPAIRSPVPRCPLPKKAGLMNPIITRPALLRIVPQNRTCSLLLLRSTTRDAKLEGHHDGEAVEHDDLSDVLGAVVVLTSSSGSAKVIVLVRIAFAGIPTQKSVLRNSPLIITCLMSLTSFRDAVTNP